MIVPTVGRIVLYRPEGPNGPTLAAVVCGVNSESNVNLAVFDMYGGGPAAAPSTHLRQPDEGVPMAPYAEWMPYQKAVAAGQQPTLHA